ncbi:hypothetical protein AMECASPLE_002993 [Ameca splendens]|uniref:Uncharacterized protein n=1 Tax=Ameca splendens TaxID=208324 RepID=A0ABV0Z7A1_9TELE
MVMDGNQVCLVPLYGGKQMLYCKATQQHRLLVQGGKGRDAQPCLPWGPPCLRRQDPSSVSKAIFTNAWKLLLLSLRLSCEGIKQRQIPSLGTQQSGQGVTKLRHRSRGLVLQSCSFNYFDFVKCLPPCFLLSSPF